MRSGRCPKCEFTEVHQTTQPLYLGVHRGLLQGAQDPETDVFFCGVCGYVERHVIRIDRKALAEKWQKVPLRDEGTTLDSI